MAGKPAVTRLTHSRYSLEHHGRLLAPVVTLPINFPGGALALVLYVHVHVHGLVDLHLIVLLVLEILHIPGGTLLLGPHVTRPRTRPRGHAHTLVQSGEQLGMGVLGGLRLEVAGAGWGRGAEEERRRQSSQELLPCLRMGSRSAQWCNTSSHRLAAPSACTAKPSPQSF